MNRTTTAARTRRVSGRLILVVGIFGVALGIAGGAQAADLITGKQIKDGTVTGRDVRDGTIRGLDVADGSLEAKDYAGVVAGPQGPQGDKGTPGAPGVEYQYFVRSTIEFLPPGQIGQAAAECDPGHVAIGGGLDADAGRRLQLLDSSPLGTSVEQRTSWATRVHNESAITARVTTYALCAQVQP